MAYYWVGSPELSEDDTAALGLDQAFDDQGGAEAWLTSSYTDLADAGIREVALYDEGRLVYGPMGLED